MWKGLFTIFLAAAAALAQVSFLSQLSFPFSALSIPIVAMTYHLARNRPLSAAGWALVCGWLLDLHGLLGFGAEMMAFFASFFVVKYLFHRVVSNAGAPAFFLLAAAATITHWFALSATDGLNVLFGGVPMLVDLSFGAMLSPLRQALVNGLALVAAFAIEDRLRLGFGRAFLSHAPHHFS